MVIPPPPPRYHSAPGASGAVLLGPPGLPPPPGPPPASAMGQQAPWHGTWGRMYDGRTAFIPPPPPVTGLLHQAYNPKLHAAAAAGQNINIPPPPPPSEQMSATYIPQGDTYGEGVGIPGLGGILDEVTATFSATSQSSWGQASETTQMTTPLDDASSRERLYQGTINTRGHSIASNAASNSGIPPELTAQWPLDRVLSWLQANNFSRDWQATFKGLNLQGTHFLELGSSHGGRGNFGMMHQLVYPRLLQECTNSGTGWDQSREREEGKRMRRMIRGLVLGRNTDLAKMSMSHVRTDSVSGAPNVLPSAGTDPGGSPDVSCHETEKGTGACGVCWQR